MFKKGQLTLFIIIAIVVIAASLIGYLLYKNYQKAKELSAKEIAPVKTYLQETLAYEVSGSLILLGLQGGYSDHPEKFLQMQYHFIPYYYYDKKEAIPSKERVLEEVKKEIEKRLNELSLNFTDLELEKADPEIKINDAIEVNLPVTVKKGKMATTLTVKTTFLTPRFEEILNASNEVVKAVKAEPGAINLEVLFEQEQKYNLTINPLIYDETTTIYRIVDNQTISERPFEFYFAVENV